MNTYELTDDTNFREFFILHDGLRNVESELAFSVLDRYFCSAGCSICYLKSRWSDRASVLDQQTDIADVDLLLNVFSYFRTISSVDDLFFIKRFFPQRFEVIRQLAPLLTSSSMTDNAILQQSDILINDVDFDNVYEISFSDRFLSFHNGKMFDRVTHKLEQLLEKYQIYKIKLIATTEEISPILRKLQSWCEKKEIVVSYHFDVMSQTSKLNTDNVEPSYVSGDDESMVQIFSETVMLQNREFFLSFYNAINFRNSGFYRLQDKRWSPIKFLTEMLKMKLVLYRSFKRITTNEQQYQRYFDFVSNQVIINDDFSFLPALLMKKASNFYQQLATDHQWIDHKYGLVRSGSIQHPLTPPFHFRGFSQWIPLSKR